MLKKGFTLQEVLITMAIVGVIAAVTVPAIIENKPDATKMKFLKAYNTLTTLTNDILGDNTLYWAENPNLPCQGLECNDKSSYDIITKAHPTLKDKNFFGTDILNWANNYKYPQILASRMNLQDTPVIDNSTNTYRFTTTDGVTWEIGAQSGSNDTTITIDINAANGTQTKISDVPDGKRTNNVDTFVLKVSSLGVIKADDKDPLADAFIKNPGKITGTKEERNKAYEAYENN